MSYADKRLAAAACKWIKCPEPATMLIVVRGRLDWFCDEHAEELKGQ